MRRGLAVLLLLPLAGCGLAADLTGAAAGIAAGTVTSNPAAGFAVAVGTRAGVQAGLDWAVRARARGEQDAVAEIIGSLAPGEARPWQIRHDIPIGDDEGEVRLLREMVTPLSTCREALFSVSEGGWFVTTACRQGERWKWAAAEPAVPRWGALQ